LLLLSGIGSKAKLNEYSIPCLVDLPGVGENLQDHPDVLQKMRTKMSTVSCTHLGNIIPQIQGMLEYRR
jgi:choline dehydrogenase-like flavoprotein